MSDLLEHDPQLVCRQAEELLARDRVAQARALIADALRAAPDHADLLYLAARADWQANEHARARETLQRVLALAPAHFAAQVLLFELLAWDGELAQAEQVILPLLRSHPQEASLWARYSRLMLQALHVRRRAGWRRKPCAWRQIANRRCAPRPCATSSRCATAPTASRCSACWRTTRKTCTR
jgi:predicted Zn-dependent protease